jgi:cytidylate kinase
MGTVVFPDADVKFFLSAAPKVRAKRRYEERKHQSSETFEEIQTDLKKRDFQDRTRKLSPLKPAAEAIRIDSSKMTLEQVVSAMLSRIKKTVPAS